MAAKDYLAKLSRFQHSLSTQTVALKILHQIGLVDPPPLICSIDNPVPAMQGNVHHEPLFQQSDEVPKLKHSPYLLFLHPIDLPQWLPTSE